MAPEQPGASSAADTYSEETPVPGKKPFPTALPEVVHGRYRLGLLLGAGGFGRVFEARDELLGRSVALKVLQPRRAAADPRAVQRFFEEARIVARLDHPNIVPVYDLGLLDGTPWMAMRMVRGVSLAKLLQGGGLGRVRATEMLKQVLLALEHAHGRGLVHRDVKPSNLILESRDDGSEHVWLADFGIARSLTADDESTEAVRGTPVYMPPEQITGRRVDQRADLFAVGCVACELVTGTRCFEGASFPEILHKVIHEPARGLDELEALAGPAYAAWVRRALAKSPEDRPASAGVMRRGLEALDHARGAAPALRTSWWRSPAASWDGRHVLEARGLTKRFGRRADALRGLDLDVPAGGIFGLLGNNGAGKTTLLRIALGLYTPDRGTVRVFGRDPRRQRTAVLSRVGYVPEVPAAYPFLRVREVLALVRLTRPAWDEPYAYRLLARFELPLDARVRELSRGLKTKLSLVCALGPRPEFLVLDDPTLGLDAVVLQDFFDTLQEASDREGVSVLLSSHNLEDLERIVTHVGFLKDGRLLLSGGLGDVKRRARRVELRFRAEAEVPSLASLPALRTLRASGRHLTGLVVDASPATLDGLRALGAEEIQLIEPSLKEAFMGLMREPPPS